MVSVTFCGHQATPGSTSPMIPAVSKFFFQWGLKRQRDSSEEVSLCTTVSCSSEYQQAWWRQGPGDSRPQQDLSENLILHAAGTRRTHAKGTDEDHVWVHLPNRMLSRPAAPPCYLHPQPVSHSIVGTATAERQKNSRSRAALVPALSKAAKMGQSFCLPGGGGMEASRPRCCWLLLF